MKYIIFDLDDTLLNKEKQITSFTFDVLKRYQAHGHKLVINTARNLQTTSHIIDELQCDYTILNGGSLIVDRDKKVIYECTIDESTSDALLQELKELAINKGLRAESVDGLYSWNVDRTPGPSIHFDFNNPLNKKCYKILIGCREHGKLTELANKYGLLYTPYYKGDWGRFTRIEATKWLGVTSLLDIINGDVKDTITFGDDIGDIEMLQNAGIGVCVSNSQPSVLAVIKNVTSASYEDGVAKYLLENVSLDS